MTGPAASSTDIGAPATDEGSGTGRYGERVFPTDDQPLREQWMYLQRWEGTTGGRMPILEVDTEHATDEGFWYAVRNSSAMSGLRTLPWNYQPYGISCDIPEYFNLTLNPCLNTYWCALDPDAVERYAPGYQENLNRCRTRNGQPRKWADPDQGFDCTNRELDWHTPMTIQAATAYACAPWEDPKTCQTDLSREHLAPLQYWVPEPAWCVGVRADINRYGTTAKGYSPLEDHTAVNVPGCTGAGDAPKCTPAQAVSPSCGGPVVPTTNPTLSPTPTPTPPPTPTPTPTPSRTRRRGRTRRPRARTGR